MIDKMRDWVMDQADALIGSLTDTLKKPMSREDKLQAATNDVWPSLLERLQKAAVATEEAHSGRLLENNAIDVATLSLNHIREYAEEVYGDNGTYQKLLEREGEPTEQQLQGMSFNEIWLFSDE